MCGLKNSFCVCQQQDETFNGFVLLGGKHSQKEKNFFYRKGSRLIFLQQATVKWSRQRGERGNSLSSCFDPDSAATQLQKKYCELWDGDHTLRKSSLFFANCSLSPESV